MGKPTPGSDKRFTPASALMPSYDLQVSGWPEGKNYDKFAMALKNTINEPTTLRCVVWGVESQEKNQDRRKSKSQGGGQRTRCQLCCRRKASGAAGHWPVDARKAEGRQQMEKPWRNWRRKSCMANHDAGTVSECLPTSVGNASVRVQGRREYVMKKN